MTSALFQKFDELQVAGKLPNNPESVFAALIPFFSGSRKLHASQITEMRKGRLAPDHPAYIRIEAAIKTYCAEHKIEFGTVETSSPSLPAPPQAKLAYLEMPSALNGYWIVVHFASARLTKKDHVPPLSRRVAIIRYGKEKHHHHQQFNISGRSRTHEGKVRHLHSKLYFRGKDTTHGEEEVYLLMADIRPDFDGVYFHEGIITGISLSPFSPAAGDIYSSKVLIQKLSLKDIEMAAIDDALKTEARKKLCRYFEPDAPLEFADDLSAHLNGVKQSIVTAIRKFDALIADGLDKSTRLFI